jgi:hypothetical protein
VGGGPLGVVNDEAALVQAALEAGEGHFGGLRLAEK